MEAFYGQRGENRAGLVLGNRFYTYLSGELNLAGRQAGEAGKAGRQAFVGQKKNEKQNESLMLRQHSSFHSFIPGQNEAKNAGRKPFAATYLFVLPSLSAWGKKKSSNSFDYQRHQLSVELGQRSDP